MITLNKIYKYGNLIINLIDNDQLNYSEHICKSTCATKT